jgi:hypothetical protein
MSDFLERLERELLVAGQRANSLQVSPRRSKRPVVRLVPLFASILVIAVVATIAIARHSASDAIAPSSRPQVGQSARYTAQSCGSRHGGGQPDLPRVVGGDATAPAQLVSLVGALRKPATPGDAVNLREFTGGADGVLEVYARYIRVVAGPHGERIALIPARVCNPTQAAGRSPDHGPQVALLIATLSPAQVRTVSVGTADDIRAARANPLFGGWVSRNTRVEVTIVPDGVTRVVFHCPGQQPANSVAVVHWNVGIANPVCKSGPSSATWYSASGKAIRTIQVD